MFFIIFPVLVILVFWIGGYCDGRLTSSANAKISYKLFKRMHKQFPEKWKLDINYVSFYYEIPKDSDEYTKLNPSKEFRGYFGPIDLIRYWFYCADYNRALNEERAARDYADVIKAFEELEKKVT